MKAKSKTFTVFNFGCRVNSAETNQWSQLFVNQGYQPNTNHSPNIFLVNTCAVTKKGEYESIFKIKQLSQDFPNSTIIATGCADLNKVADLPNVKVYFNQSKEKLLANLNAVYTRQIKDKYSHTNRYLLKIQSGCTHFCSYCTVPLKRPYLWSLPTDTAINTVNQAIQDGYQEVIITGVNIDQYQYSLSNLVLSLLKNTNIHLISFGSVPLNSIDPQFIKIYQNPQYQPRLSNFLHIPIQSGSDKILKLMNRPYSKKNIFEKFNSLKNISPLLRLSRSIGIKGGVGGGFSFGTDIIVGFPTESNADFQETFDLCQQIGFKKIHTFRFSPRPNTKAREIFLKSPKISKETLKSRSEQLRKLSSPNVQLS